MFLFTATGEINLILLSQEEVVLKVTSLSGEYDIPITEERRDSRLAAAAPSGTMSSREEEACPPDDRIPEANMTMQEQNIVDLLNRSWDWNQEKNIGDFKITWPATISLQCQ